MKTKAGDIRIGIGGWTFEPWRGVFYPDKLPQRRELEYAASKLTSIEINGTFYGSQKPESFRKWASRSAGRLRVLAEGPALRDQPQGAGRGRRQHQAVLRFRRARTRRPARPGAVAVRADQEIRRSRFRRVSGAAAAHDRRSHAAPRRRGPPRQLLHAGFHRAVTQAQHSASCTPSTRPIRRSPTSSATSSMRGCRKARTTSQPAIRRRRLHAWAKRLAIWADGGEPDDLPKVDDGTAEETDARRVRLRHPRGQGPRAGGGDGIDQAGRLASRDAEGAHGRTQQAVHHRLRADAGHRRARRIASAPASSCWSMSARSRRRAGPAFPRPSSPPGSTSAASAICICAGSAPRRKAARRRAAATFEQLHKIYQAHLKTPQAREEIDELSALVMKAGPVCILCYERDHTQCHRQWIAEIVAARDGAPSTICWRRSSDDDRSARPPAASRRLNWLASDQWGRHRTAMGALTATNENDENGTMDKIDFMNGQIKALLNFATVVIQSHPSPDDPAPSFRDRRPQPIRIRPRGCRCPKPMSTAWPISTARSPSRSSTRSGSQGNEISVIASEATKIPWGWIAARSDARLRLLNPLHWRRPMLHDHPSVGPTAIRTQFGAIFVSLELSRSNWLVTSLSPGNGEKMSQMQPAGRRHRRACWRGLPISSARPRSEPDRTIRSSTSRRPGSTGSGCTGCCRTKGSRATWSMPPRSRRRAGAGGPRPTRSTARRCCGRCWRSSAASRGCARWWLRPRPRRRTADDSAASARR